jgi:hypothetical protein
MPFVSLIFINLDHLLSLVVATIKEISTLNPLNPYATLFPGADSFFSYTGSLTTPPCDSDATWIVLSTPVPISSDDLEILRGVLLEVNETVADYDGSTNRPVVPAAGRSISFSSAFSIKEDMITKDDHNDNSGNTLVVAYAALAVAVLASVMGFVGFLVIYQFHRQKFLKQPPEEKGDLL